MSLMRLFVKRNVMEIEAARTTRLVAADLKCHPERRGKREEDLIYPLTRPAPGQGAPIGLPGNAAHSGNDTCDYRRTCNP